MIPSVYAGFSRRAAAIMFDLAILAVLWVLLFLLAVAAQIAASGEAPVIQDMMGEHPTAVSTALMGFYYLYAILVSCLYFTYFTGYTGQTPGKMLFHLYVIRDDGGKVNYRDALIRWFGYLVSSMIFYLGFLWVLFDRRKQGWHDKLAGSLVIHLPRENIVCSPPEEVRPVSPFADDHREGREPSQESVAFPCQEPLKAPVAPGAESEKDLDKGKGIY